MKKTKVIIPALGLLLLSTAASVTGTVAWFSANATVTATGMNVKVKAQEGIVIANAAAGTYNASAASAKTTCANLIPGSTSNLSTWFTSKSTDPNNANTQQEYAAAVEWTTNDSDASYVVHDFYVRSSAASALTIASYDVNKVEAKVGDAAPAQVLSKALRVGIKTEGSSNIYIYAPVTGYTASYTVQPSVGAYTDTGRITVAPIAGTTISKDTSVTSLPANTANGTHVAVYVWFEGEDANCISDNIQATLEQLSINVVFGYTAA